MVFVWIVRWIRSVDADQFLRMIRSRLYMFEVWRGNKWIRCLIIIQNQCIQIVQIDHRISDLPEFDSAWWDIDCRSWIMKSTSQERPIYCRSWRFLTFSIGLISKKNKSMKNKKTKEDWNRLKFAFVLSQHLFPVIVSNKNSVEMFKRKMCGLLPEKIRSGQCCS